MQVYIVKKYYPWLPSTRPYNNFGRSRSRVGTKPGPPLLDPHMDPLWTPLWTPIWTTNLDPPHQILNPQLQNKPYPNLWPLSPHPLTWT
jgi:hypothetical protein